MKKIIGLLLYLIKKRGVILYEKIFLPIGLDTYISIDKIVAVSTPDSAPIRRLIQEAKANNMCRDFTKGRTCRSVIICMNREICLSPVQPSTLVERTEKPLNK